MEYTVAIFTLVSTLKAKLKFAYFQKIKLKWEEQENRERWITTFKIIE
jgi:hypothetical protein